MWHLGAWLGRGTGEVRLHPRHGEGGREVRPDLGFNGGEN